MDARAFQPLAAYFADDLSETLSGFFAPNSNGTTVAFVLDDTGVETREGAALVQELSHLLATGHRAHSSNFPAHELGTVQSHVTEHRAELLAAWDEYFAR